MDQTKLVAALIVAGVLGGAVGAGAVVMLGGEKTERPKKERIEHETAANDDAEQSDERITRLEQEIATLRRSNKTNDALQEYSRALKKKREAAAAGEETDELAPVVDGEDPTFELAVRTVMDRVQWEEDEERKVTRQQQRDERAARQTDLLTQRLGLSAAQKPRLQAILSEQMNAFRDLRSGDSGQPRPATRTEWRQRIDGIRKESETKLSEVLSEEQMKLYGEFVAEEGFGRMGGGRRGDRGRQGDRAERE
jgi:hypothetical protein